MRIDSDRIRKILNGIERKYIIIKIELFDSDMKDLILELREFAKSEIGSNSIFQRNRDGTNLDQ